MTELLGEDIESPRFPSGDNLGRTQLNWLEVVNQKHLRRELRVEVRVREQLLLDQHRVGTRFGNDSDTVATSITLVNHLSDVVKATLLQFGLDLFSQLLGIAPRGQVRKGQRGAIFASRTFLLARLNASTATNGPRTGFLVLTKTVVIDDVTASAERRSQGCSVDNCVANVTEVVRWYFGGETDTDALLSI